jgi:riboflavin biosynthesis pyrimidine reductase
MRILSEQGATPPGVIDEHVQLGTWRPPDRAFVRLNMVSSADGGSAVGGVSGGLGNSDDHKVFAALRGTADAVVVAMRTAAVEQYRAPTDGDLQIYVIAHTPDISGDPGLFASGRGTLVLAEDAGPAPDGVPTLRSGTGGNVDLAGVCARLVGQVVMLEGGATLAGLMVSLGLVDELFVTIAPLVISGDSRRIVHGPDADPTAWELQHGFVDEQGFLFLRYRHPRSTG